MEASWDALSPYSFRSRMDEAKDVAATKGPRRLSRGVTYRRSSLTEWLSVAQAATELGCNAARVRALVGQGRIKGARGKPWRIPAKLQPDGSYRIVVTESVKGPKLKMADRCTVKPIVPF